MSVFCSCVRGNIRSAIRVSFVEKAKKTTNAPGHDLGVSLDLFGVKANHLEPFEGDRATERDVALTWSDHTSRLASLLQGWTLEGCSAHPSRRPCASRP